MVKIVRATLQDVEHITPLFDQYRVFYGQESDMNRARKFLKKLFSKKESILFLAFENEKAVGFTQLYKTFSSVTMEPFFILNDLFVEATHRKLGIGELLLKEAKKHCISKGYKGLALETAIDNPAQKLYERLGWKKDEGFLHYFWKTSEF